MYNPVYSYFDCLHLHRAPGIFFKRIKNEYVTIAKMDEGRKRVIGLMAAILASLHMQTADDLFGGPQGSPRTDKLIAASIQWAEKIMAKIDDRFPRE